MSIREIIRAMNILHRFPKFSRIIKHPLLASYSYYKFRKMKRNCAFFGGFAGSDIFYSLGLEITDYKNVSIGHRCTFGGKVLLHAHDKIDIGNDCMFAYGAVVTTATHDYNTRIMSQSFITKPVKIGSNVWIGINSIILPGISIGNGAVIGAGSIVTRNIPENAIVAGNPAKILKYRDV